MRKTLAIVTIGGLLAAAGSAFAQTPLTPPPVYTVKFVCGTQSPLRGATAPTEPPVKPGNYATAINIEALVNDIQVSTVISVANSALQPISGPSFGMLVNQTRDITCADIARAVGSSAPAFITGFVNITPAPALSVSAVYTSQGCGFALGILPILPVCSGPTSIDVVPQQAVTPPAPATGGV